MKSSNTTLSTMDIIVKKSNIQGKGVFAKRDFKKGEIILKWNPKILEKTEVDKLKNIQKNYVYKIEENKFYLMQPPEKFVNHSCKANTNVKNNCDVAIRDIKKGEEITADYGKDGMTSFVCQCGNINCKGFVKHY